MSLPDQDPCCADVKTGVLHCAGDDKGSPIPGKPEDEAQLFGEDGDFPILAWRRSVEDHWNYSHPRRLLIHSAVNPLPVDLAGVEAADHPLAGFATMREIPQAFEGGESWWLLERTDGKNDAPFTSLDPRLDDTPAFPVAIVRPLGRAYLTSRIGGDDDWPWKRIAVESATTGSREVRIAIIDNGYFPDGGYDSFVEALDGQNLSSAKDLINESDSHGAATLLFAAEVIRQAENAAKKVTLVPYRVLNDKECATEELLIDALNHIADNKIHIVIAPWLIRQEKSALEGEVAKLEKLGILFLTGPANIGLDLDDCSCAQQMAYWSPTNIGVVGAIGRQDTWEGAYGAKTVDAGAPGASIYHRLLDNNVSGSSYAAPIAGAMVAVELTHRGEDVNAITVWREMLDRLKETSPCEAQHAKCTHCVSRGIVSFTPKP